MNALMALVWDAHVHHIAIHRWFEDAPERGWATCPITEAGFVRVSSNRKALGGAVSPESARAVLAGARSAGGHRFLTNDVSMTDADLPPLAGHRQVTDAVLLAVARRHGLRLVTFDAGLRALAVDGEVELLRV